MAKPDWLSETSTTTDRIKLAEAPLVEVPPAPARSGRARLMKIREMVDEGLLPVGTIKDRPDSAATVVNGQRVEFRGELMSFNSGPAKRPAGQQSSSTNGRCCRTGGSSRRCVSTKPIPPKNNEEGE